MLTRIKRYTDSTMIGYFGGGGDPPPPPTNQTVTQTQEIPEYVKPYAREFLGRAQGLSNEPYEPYTGQRIADLNPLHYQGIGQIENTAYSPLLPSAENQMLGTIGGAYLNANPYVDRMFDQAAQGVVNQYTGSVMPGIDAAANRANALGGSAYQEYSDRARFDLGQNLNNLATNIYGGNYARERANQQQAMLGAPQFAEGNYRAGQALLGAGDILRSYEQDLLNLDREDFERARNQRYANLDVLGNALGISMGGGGTTQTTSPSFYQASPTAGAIGGGLLGYGLGSAVSGSLAPGNANLLGGGLGALGGYLI